MAGGKKARPQTSHLPPLLPWDLQGMGTSLVSTEPPPPWSNQSLHRPETCSARSPTRFPLWHICTFIFYMLICFIISVSLCLSWLHVCVLTKFVSTHVLTGICVHTHLEIKWNLYTPVYWSLVMMFCGFVSDALYVKLADQLLKTI